MASTLARRCAAANHCYLVKSCSTFLDTCCWNRILTSYAKFDGLDSARRLFDDIPQRDRVSWNSLIAAHVYEERYDDAWALFLSMLRKGMAFDEYTVGSVLKAVACVGFIEFGCQLHCLVAKCGLDSNVYVGSALLDMYAKCGQVRDAYFVFQLMSIRNTVSWNALISGFVHVSDLKIVFQIFSQMGRKGVVTDEATFASILTLMDKPEYSNLLSQVHAKIVKYGWVADTVVHNAAIMAYSLCGAIVESRRVFDELSDSKDLVTWNSMIASYAYHGMMEEAIDVFIQLQHTGIYQDMYTFTSLVSACIGAGQDLQGRAVHSLIVRKGLESIVPVSNSLIAMYARSFDDSTMVDALKCFHQMEFKDSVSWNSILTGFSQNSCSEEAMKFFVQMQHFHVTFDQYALSAALRSCSDLAVLQLGQLVHSLVIKLGFISNNFVTSSLMYMYSKCGIISDARKSFEESNKDNSVTWNSIMFGYAQHGQGHTVLDIFNEMQQLEVKPDHITFMAILTACSHIGLVEVGSTFLKSMGPIYGIPLRMEHYACGVDIFGRAGRLDEALELIRSMPFEPDAIVWMTLLGACRIHGNMELASLIARHLLVIDPREHSTYVILSSMFSGFEMWDNRAVIQKVMKTRGLRKVPGWSWIEINNMVHSFNAEDRSHPEFLEIYEILQIFMEGEDIKYNVSTTDLEIFFLGLA